MLIDMYIRHPQDEHAAWKHPHAQSFSFYGCFHVACSSARCSRECCREHPKLQSISCGVWMFPCCVLIWMVIDLSIEIYIYIYIYNKTSGVVWGPPRFTLRAFSHVCMSGRCMCPTRIVLVHRCFLRAAPSSHAFRGNWGCGRCCCLRRISEGSSLGAARGARGRLLLARAIVRRLVALDGLFSVAKGQALSGEPDVVATAGRKARQRA